MTSMQRRRKTGVSGCPAAILLLCWRMRWGRDEGGSGGGGGSRRPCRGNRQKKATTPATGKTAVAAEARSDSSRSGSRVVVVDL